MDGWLSRCAFGLPEPARRKQNLKGQQEGYWQTPFVISTTMILVMPRSYLVVMAVVEVDIVVVPDYNSRSARLQDEICSASWGDGLAFTYM